MREMRFREGSLIPSPRQRQVLSLVCRGFSNKEIAAALSISDQTVKNHLAMSYAKLGAANRVEAAVAWSQRPGERGAQALPTKHSGEERR